MYIILCTLLFVKIFLKLLYFLKENAKVAPAGHSTKGLLILPECRFGTQFYLPVKLLNRTRIIFIRRPGGCSLSQNNECSVHLRLHHRENGGSAGRQFFYIIF